MIFLALRWVRRSMRDLRAGKLSGWDVIFSNGRFKNLFNCNWLVIKLITFIVLISGFDDRWQTEGSMSVLSGILHGPVSAGRAENHQSKGEEMLVLGNMVQLQQPFSLFELCVLQ